MGFALLLPVALPASILIWPDYQTTLAYVGCPRHALRLLYVRNHMQHSSPLIFDQRCSNAELPSLEDRELPIDCRRPEPSLSLALGSIVFQD